MKCTFGANCTTERNNASVPFSGYSHYLLKLINSHKAFVFALVHISHNFFQCVLAVLGLHIECHFWCASAGGGAEHRAATFEKSAQLGEYFFAEFIHTSHNGLC